MLALIPGVDLVGFVGLILSNPASNITLKCRISKCMSVVLCKRRFIVNFLPRLSKLFSVAPTVQEGTDGQKFKKKKKQRGKKNHQK